MSSNSSEHKHSKENKKKIKRQKIRKRRWKTLADLPPLIEFSETEILQESKFFTRNPIQIRIKD